MEGERRTAPRFKIDQMIGYYPNREEYLWAEALNISSGGLQCRSKTPLDPLTNVFIMLGPADAAGTAGKRVRCEGYVTYCRKEDDGSYISGIHFTGIQPEDKTYFESYLSKIDGKAAGASN